jgi:hypothetical protein
VFNRFRVFYLLRRFRHFRARHRFTPGAYLFTLGGGCAGHFLSRQTRPTSSQDAITANGKFKTLAKSVL